MKYINNVRFLIKLNASFSLILFNLFKFMCATFKYNFSLKLPECKHFYHMHPIIFKKAALANSQLDKTFVISIIFVIFEFTCEIVVIFLFTFYLIHGN